MAVAAAVPAATVLGAIEQTGITHVVTVPDTHQRTVFELIDAGGTLPVIRAATEHDVFGICVGLWMTGQRPLALIQQLGLFAGANALRWARHDVVAPLPVVAGLFGRDVDVEVRNDSASAVRLCLPLLEALEIRCELIEGPDDAELIAPTLASAFEDGEVRVVLIGAPTS